jgi:hypothetical protein
MTRRSPLAIIAALTALSAIAALAPPAASQTPRRGGILTSMVIEDPPGFSIHESATISTV